MCALCDKYGTEKIIDNTRLQKALFDAAKLLKLKLIPKQRDHVMEFVHKAMDGAEAV